jgi:hypothetical protein
MGCDGVEDVKKSNTKDVHTTSYLLLLLGRGLLLNWDWL